MALQPAHQKGEFPMKDLGKGFKKAKTEALKKKKYGTMQDIHKPSAVSRYDVRARNWKDRIQNGNTLKISPNKD